MSKRLMIFLMIFTLLFQPFTAYATSSNVEGNNLHVENTYIRTTVNKDSGRFAIKTVSGSPLRDTDDNKKLLFMQLTPETSYTTFRIGGSDYIYGNKYNFDGHVSEFVEEPKYYGNVNYSKWRIGDVYISQYLIVENEGKNAGDIRIKYEVENKGAKKEIGARILLDTMLGENDGSSIRIPGQSAPITNETSFSEDNVPSFWYGMDKEASPDVVGKGTLLTGRYPNVDKMIIGHWEGLSQTKWDYIIDDSLDFTSGANEYGSADSAVALYFEPKEVSSNTETVFTTTYGIGDVTVEKKDVDNNKTSYAVGIIPSTDQIEVVGDWEKLNYYKEWGYDISEFYGTYIKYNPNPLELVVYIDNTFEDSKDIEKISFDISDALNHYSDIVELADGETSVKNIELVEKDSISQVTFKLNLKPQGENIDFEPYVNVSIINSDDLKTLVARPSAYIKIPKLTDIQNIVFAEATPKEVYELAETKNIYILGEGFTYINDATNLNIVFKKEGQDDIVVSKDLVKINSDRIISVILPYELTKGYYDIVITKGNDEEVKTFSDALEITNNEKYASRSYPEFSYPKDDYIFKIKGFVDEVEGVYSTKPGVRYVINEMIKFEGDMSIDTSNGVNTPPKITGNGKFYIDLNSSASIPKITFYEGKFELDINEEDEDIMLIADANSAFVAPLFRDIGIKCPVSIKNVKLLSNGVKIIGSAMTPNFLGLELEKDLISAGGVTLNEFQIRSDGVDADFTVEVQSPFKAGPLKSTGVELNVNTAEKEWGITAKAPMPSKAKGTANGPEKELSLTLEFVNWDELNKVGVSAEGLRIKLSPIPAEIDSLGGSITNLANTKKMPTELELTGLVIDSVSPYVLGYKAFNYEGKVKLSDYRLKTEGTGSFYWIETSNQVGEVIWDHTKTGKYNKNGVYVDINTSTPLVDFYKVDGDFKIQVDDHDNITGPKGKFKASLTVPSSVPVINGLEVPLVDATLNGSKMSSMIPTEIGMVKVTFDFKTGSISFSTNPNWIGFFGDIIKGIPDGAEFVYKNGIMAPYNELADATDVAKNAIKDIYGKMPSAGSIKDVFKGFIKWPWQYGCISNVTPMQLAYVGDSFYKDMYMVASTEIPPVSKSIRDEYEFIYAGENDGDNGLILTGNEESVLICTNITSSDDMILFDPSWNEVELNDENTIIDAKGFVNIKLDSVIKGTYTLASKNETNKNGDKIYATYTEFKKSPVFKTLTASKDGDELTITWDEENDITTDDTKVKLMLVNDVNASEGEILAENLGPNGSKVITLSEDLESGEYYVLGYIDREDVGFDYELSEPFSIINPNAPEVPEGLTATYSGNGKVDFSWVANDTEPNNYIIYYTDEDGETNYLNSDGKDITLSSTDLDPGKYTIGMYATKEIDDKVYTSENSNEILFILQEPEPPEINIDFSSTGDITEKYATLNGEDFVQRFINKRNLSVKGTSDKNTDVEIYINDILEDTITDTTDFDYNLTFSEDGDYNIKFVAIADNGDTSQYYYDFGVDTVAPYLEVVSPVNGDKVSDTFILVSGQSEPSCDLKVNGMTVDMDENGYFDFDLLPAYALSNNISIVAKDYAGNVTEYEASLANETHEITGFEMSCEKTTMYSDETQLIYGVITDVLSQKNRLSSDNVTFIIEGGEDIACIDSAGRLTPKKIGTVIIKGVFVGSAEVTLEDEITITIINRPTSTSSSKNSSLNINKIYSRNIDFKKEGTLQLPDTAEISFPIGSIESDTRFEVRIVDKNKNNIKLPKSTFVELVGDIIQVNSSGSRRFNKPIKLTFDLKSDNIDNHKNYGIYYYNEEFEKWIYIGGEIENGKITTEVSHLTKFAVFYNEDMKRMNDIDNHWANRYINTLVGRGVINGFPNNDGSYNFKPNNPITRAEFITLAVKMYGFDTNVDYNLNFADYDKIPTWAMLYMQSAYANGILTGVAKNGQIYLKPNDNITREQIVTLLGKGYDYTQTSECNFTDNDKIAPWAKEFVDKMVDLNVITGKPDGSFAPKDNATRAECATIIYKLIEVIEGK